MLKTETYTFKNDQRYFKYGDLIHILHVYYMKALTHQLPYEKYYNLKQRSKNKYNRIANDRCFHMYSPCREIITTRLIQEFIEWKPFIKGINVVKIRKYLDEFLCLHRSNDFYSGSNRTYQFVSNDYKIEILWALSQFGIDYLSYNDIPRHVEQLTRLILFGKQYLQKLFDYDFKLGNHYMSHFSNKESRSYMRNDWSKWGYRQFESEPEPNIKKDIVSPNYKTEASVQFRYNQELNTWSSDGASAYTDSNMRVQFYNTSDNSAANTTFGSTSNANYRPTTTSLTGTFV